MARILVIDDDRSLREVVRFILEEAGHEVISAKSGDDGIRLFDSEPVDLVLSDMKMPGRDGLDVLRHVQDSRSAGKVPVIILTAYGTVEQAVEAMKLGACNYVLKPFNRDDLKLTIEQALYTRALESDNANLRRLLRQKTADLALVYVSDAMRRVVDQIKRAAPTDASILITGESGTGKELAARAVHDLSRRWDKPFVALNCSAIPVNLMESELFGHARGSFTGAQAAALGRIRSAHGGTLFLDEIAELPLTLQPKLLRVLEQKTVDPVGDARSYPVDFRLVSATNRDLRQALKHRDFREDLYYRLEIVHLYIPPLRERREDIPVLWNHFSRLHAGHGMRSSAILLERLQQREWRGNVRELKNMNQRMVMLRRGDTLEESDLQQAIAASEPVVSTRLAAPESWSPEPQSGELLPGALPENGLSLPALEKEVIRRALAKFEGNKSRAAVYLGIPRHVLIYRIQKHGLGRKRE